LDPNFTSAGLSVFLILSQTTLDGRTRSYAWRPKVERVPQANSRYTVHQMHSKASVCGLPASTAHMYIHNIELCKLVAPYLRSSHLSRLKSCIVPCRARCTIQHKWSLQVVLLHLHYRSFGSPRALPNRGHGTTKYKRVRRANTPLSVITPPNSSRNTHAKSDNTLHRPSLVCIPFSLPAVTEFGNPVESFCALHA